MAENDKAREYLGKIRNALKRSYGRCYLRWIEEGHQKGKEPPQPNNLSLTVTQAVRTQLDEYLGAPPQTP